MTKPRRLLLGPWPPENWRRDDRIPLMTIRKDLLYCLLSQCGEVVPWEIPAMTPAEVLTRLNAAGPPLDDAALPMIEAVLEGMFADGIVGRIPPPTTGEAASYVARVSAEADLPKGKPIMLLPLRHGVERSLALGAVGIVVDELADEQRAPHGR